MRKEHPPYPAEELLDDLYNTMRRASLNSKYYACQASLYGRLHKYYEIVLALGASTVIASWKVWDQPIAHGFWAGFLGIVAVLVVLKPFLGLAEKAQRYTELYIGHKDSYLDLHRLSTTIKTRPELWAGLQEQMDLAFDRYKKLALRDDLKPRKRLLRRCYNEVNAEQPEKFWYPDYTKESANESRPEAPHSRGTTEATRSPTITRSITGGEEPVQEELGASPTGATRALAEKEINKT